MMLNGTNMGIIKGVKLYNHNPDCDPDIRNILDEFIKFQENTVEQLKKYLQKTDKYKSYIIRLYNKCLSN